MMTPRSSRGFAMLAALVITAFAAAFALLALSAVLGLGSVEGSDAGARRARARFVESIDAAADNSRWYPGAPEGVLASDEGFREQGWWETSCSLLPLVDDGGWPALRVQSTAGVRSARCGGEATMELQREQWALGVICAGDVRAASTITIRGSGLFAGGSVRGRERISFEHAEGSVPEPGPPADVVRGDLFPEAAIHACKSIYADGTEIHLGALSDWPADSDSHTGQAIPEELFAAPSAAWIATATRHAADLVPGLQNGRLDLGVVDLMPDATAGRCLILPPGDAAVVGSVPQGSRQLVLFADGDVELGEPGLTTAFEGSVVVTGSLRVVGDVVLHGSLFAGSLDVAGTLDVGVDRDWRQEPVAGACLPVIVELSQ